VISVVTCTHNPHKEVLARVVTALRDQTLHKDYWEWIIVDNQSETSVSSWLDIGWHPSAIVVCENELGLTPARLRGIKQAKYPVIVFVDDDNLLNPEYLKTAEILLRTHATLGAIGGSIEGEFERKPPRWFTHREYEMLGIRPVMENLWGNQKRNWQIHPIGAGMVIKSEVARAYARQLSSDCSRRQLDRRGSSLVSGGDNDIVGTALDLGYGVGRFVSLRLIHLIPKERLTLDYVVRLAEGIGYSRRILYLLDSAGNGPIQARWFMRISWLRHWIVRLRRPAPLKKIDRAFSAGEQRAVAEWQGRNAT
jgi:glycosyltransferase involved in cell wall biosynthesis